MTIMDLIGVFETRMGALWYIHNEDCSKSYQKKVMASIADHNFHALLSEKVKAFRIVDDGNTYEIVTE